MQKCQTLSSFSKWEISPFPFLTSLYTEYLWVWACLDKRIIWRRTLGFSDIMDRQLIGNKNKHWLQSYVSIQNSQNFPVPHRKWRVTAGPCTHYIWVHCVAGSYTRTRPVVHWHVTTYTQNMNGGRNLRNFQKSTEAQILDLISSSGFIVNLSRYLLQKHNQRSQNLPVRLQRPQKRLIINEQAGDIQSSLVMSIWFSKHGCSRCIMLRSG